MANLKGTKTEVNLLTAFAGESQARNRYDFYSKKAKKEGYEQIAAIFSETADQERQHAKRLFQFLQGGEVEIKASFPAGKIGTTLENLKAAAEGEHYENTIMYPEFAKIAREEDLENIAKIFEAIVEAEKHHEKRFLGFASMLENGTLFKRSEKTVWYCRKCGYMHVGEEPPELCPACSHPKAYFEEIDPRWNR